jgi:hypothetical protein
MNSKRFQMMKLDRHMSLCYDTMTIHRFTHDW